MDGQPPGYYDFQQQQLMDTTTYPINNCPVVPINTSPTFDISNGVPAMELWPGHLKFTVEFSKAQDKTKATPWIYSTKLKKLFVSMDKACPISFRMDNLSQEFHRYCIRGQMVYSKADHFQDPVERCPAHKGTGPPLPYTPHVLRCEDNDSRYVDHSDMRHSVVVPLKPPAPGTQSVSLCYKFMCLSSCQGGLNRRPTKLIFTLESLTNGEVVGRYACDVRICSCPGRDIRAEEARFDKNHSHDPTATETDSSNLIPIELPSMAQLKGKIKKRKAIPPPQVAQTDSTEDDDGIYNLNVNIKGLKNYNFIKDIISRFQHDYDGFPPGNNDQANHTDTGKRFKKEEP
ncbi:hypothetical protein DAPPUDRAFT_304717 [Daphnia pulex]|uniref:p53 DNA-binding domain-containing protein n=1 Tax=Daphnia pulex TaxID=6669 RepID=E9FW11_DAPPU|nr:hypothetical protein DAPPUDRAFT_304717 [Daphnia pulex]|eukprot:EFX89004.1 hypothetical protein DAPPUDRAFT_304717 [Daphnia pulex]